MMDYELSRKAIQLRKKTLEAIVRAGGGHTGEACPAWTS